MKIRVTLAPPNPEIAEALCLVLPTLDMRAAASKLIGTWVDAVTGSLGTKKGPGLENLLAFFSTSLHETAIVKDYSKRVPHARQFVQWTLSS